MIRASDAQPNLLAWLRGVGNFAKRTRLSRFKTDRWRFAPSISSRSQADSYETAIDREVAKAASALNENG
jgi:hypothetical protein